MTSTWLKIRTSLVILCISVGFLSVVTAGQIAILKGGSREVIPLESGLSAVEAIDKYQKDKNLSHYRQIDKTEAIPIVELLHPTESSEPELLNRDEYELRWNDNGMAVNFGFDTRDSIAQWFVPLGGAIVKRILIRPVNFVGTVEFFLHTSNYNGEATSYSCTDANGWIGLYDTLTGEWIEGDNECFNEPPLGDELWPGLSGNGYIVSFDSTHFQSWVEIDLGVFGYPDVGSDPFFIDGFVTRTDGWGFYAWRFPEVPYHGFKYYDSTGTSGNPGWHIRSYGWDLYAIVEYYEDIPPFIEDVTQVPTSLSPDPREVEATIWDENPAGGAYGVAEAWLYWKVGEVMDSVQMTFEGDSIYSGFVPGFIPGMNPYTVVRYWVGAVDVMGNWSYSIQYTYTIVFECRNLFIYNSNNILLDSPYLYLQGIPEGFPCDVWLGTYGQVNYEVLQNYTTVIEVQPGGPLTCTVGLDSWLDDGGKNLIISGDEYLGACFYGWPDDPVIIPDTDFVYQYLGVSTYYPDINYTQSGDQYGISRLITVEGDFISDSLYEFLGDSLYLNYDPNYEIGEYNYLDGIEPVNGANVSYYGVTGVLDSNFVPTGTDTLPTAVYYELDNGSKTAFFAFDVLSLNSMSVNAGALHDTSQGYYWIGIYPEGPIPQALLWMDAYVNVVDDGEVHIPEGFFLHQNYPNPFNPVTTIRYDLPELSNVQLSIYDLLGREVEVLVSDRMVSGEHKVVWDASDIPSGIYIYRLEVRKDGILRYKDAKKLVVLK